MKGQIPENLNFANCENLITHNDIQTNQLKQALVFCMGHKQGCLICLHIIKKTGQKRKVFPHLRQTSYQGQLYLTNGSMRCPNLMRMPRASRVTALNQIPEICQGCLRRTTGACWACTKGLSNKNIVRPADSITSFANVMSV